PSSRAGSGSPRLSKPSPTCCTPPTNGRFYPLTWMRYSTRSAGHVTGRGAPSHKPSPPRCQQKPPEWCEKGPAAEMMFVIGIVLFALAILISVAVHECEQKWVARATSMKVRRYLVGL